MQALRFKSKTKLVYQDIVYRGYSISEIPKSLSVLSMTRTNDKDGITEWFNYKGLTWIAE